MNRKETSPEDSALAAELVLGILSKAEEAQARARAATDASFAAEVAAWEADLMPMLQGPDAQPPAHIWTQVQAAIGKETGQDTGGQVRLWRGLTFASAAVALLLGVTLMNRQAPVAVAPSPLLASLGSETGPAAMMASYDPAAGMLTTLPLSMPVSIKSGALFPELWIIPVGGTAISLGLLDPAKASSHSLAATHRSLMAQGATLAITPEPAGGAPGGKATGPVIASGTIVKT